MTGISFSDENPFAIPLQTGTVQEFRLFLQLLYSGIGGYLTSCEVTFLTNALIPCLHETHVGKAFTLLK